MGNVDADQEFLVDEDLIEEVEAEIIASLSDDEYPVNYERFEILYGTFEDLERWADNHGQ